MMHLAYCGGGRLIGNSRELMPLNNSLNQDIHVSVGKHSAMLIVVKDFEDKDPHLFSMSTPKDLVSAYMQVFDPETGVATTPKRIV